MEKAPKNKPNKKILIIIAAVLVIAIIVVLVVRGRSGKDGEEKEKKREPVSLENTYSIPMEEMYCNIKDSKKILKIKMTVQTGIESNEEIISSRQFVIRDEANKIIRNATEDELAGQGYENVRRAIEKTIQNYFSDETIVVYFDDFVFQ